MNTEQNIYVTIPDFVQQMEARIIDNNNGVVYVEFDPDLLAKFNKVMQSYVANDGAYRADDLVNTWQAILQGED